MHLNGENANSQAGFSLHFGTFRQEQSIEIIVLFPFSIGDISVRSTSNVTLC